MTGNPLWKLLNMSKRRKTSLVAGILVLIFLLFWNERAFLHRSTGPSSTIVFHVLPGATFRSVVFDLAKIGVTDYPETLVFWGDLLGIDTNIHAGVYEISPEMSPFKVLYDLHNGQKYFYRLTVPEGFTMAQVARRMARLGIGTEQEILALSSDPVFLREENIPSTSVEGFLFPDTYFLPKEANVKDVFQMMISRFRTVFQTIRKQSPHPPVFSEKDLVTLASIVQKETGHPKDMAIVASIFINRLKQHMKLQSDPTVIYALNGRRKLHSRDLRIDSPYNTYRYHGLPPTPIDNPGKEALQAVLNPQPVSYLYFVSDKHGSQIYSDTLDGQDRAIRKVIRGE
ncbi:MAG: endolytic transglycosylase MltG [Nitrospirae bacterium]|nr:endolytic transglycosylase MltG [Nitrospirota bacterium]